MKVLLLLLYLLVNIIINMYFSSSLLLLCTLILGPLLYSFLYLKFLPSVLEFILLIITSIHYFYFLLGECTFPFYIYIYLWLFYYIFLSHCISLYFNSCNYIVFFYLLLFYTLICGIYLSRYIHVSHMSFVFLELNFYILFIFSVLFIFYRPYFISWLGEVSSLNKVRLICFLYLYISNVGFMYFFIRLLITDNLYNLYFISVLLNVSSVYSIFIINFFSYGYIFILIRALLLLYAVYSTTNPDVSICSIVDGYLSRFFGFVICPSGSLYRFSPVILIILLVCLCRCFLFDIILGFYPNIIFTIFFICLVLVDKLFITYPVYLYTVLYVLYVLASFYIFVLIYTLTLNVILDLCSAQNCLSFFFISTTYCMQNNNPRYLDLLLRFKHLGCTLNYYMSLFTSDKDMHRLVTNIYKQRNNLRIYTCTNLSELHLSTSNFLFSYMLLNSVEMPNCIVSLVNTGSCDCSIKPCCKDIGFSDLCERYKLFYRSISTFNFHINSLYLELAYLVLGKMPAYYKSDSIYQYLLIRIFKVIDFNIYKCVDTFLNYKFNDVLVYVLTSYLDLVVINSVFVSLNGLPCLGLDRQVPLFKLRFILNLYIDPIMVRYEFLKFYSVLTLFRINNVLDCDRYTFCNSCEIIELDGLVLFTTMFMDLINKLLDCSLFKMEVLKFYKFLLSINSCNSEVLNIHVLYILDNYFIPLKVQFLNDVVLQFSSVYFNKFKSLLLYFTLVCANDLNGGNFTPLSSVLLDDKLYKLFLFIS